MEIYRINSDHQEESIQVDTRKAAIKQLKKVSKSLLKEAKKTDSEVSSAIVIDVAKQNFNVGYELILKKRTELEQKKYNQKYNLFAKVTLWLFDHGVMVGDFSTIIKLRKKFDAILGLERLEIMDELKESGLYLEVSPKNQAKEKEELKELRKKALQNEKLIALVPADPVKRYLNYWVIGNEEEVVAGEVRYLGHDQDNNPEFEVKRGGREEYSIIAGVANLRNFIAFGEDTPEKDKSLHTKKELTEALASEGL